MVSLKSFLHYFSPARPAQPLSEAEKRQIEALIQAFGGEANITQVDACITRLRVTVRHLADVDTDALQQQGALGVIILGQQVMLFSVNSPMRCVSFWMNILPPGNK